MKDEWIELKKKQFATSEIITVFRTLLDEWSYHPERDVHQIVKNYYYGETEKLADVEEKLDKLERNGFGKEKKKMEEIYGNSFKSSVNNS